jgi:hypothetical protein
VRFVVAVARDSEPRDPIRGTSDDNDRIRTSYAGSDPSGCPRPSQTFLDQISRHEGDLEDVGPACEAYGDLGACHLRSANERGLRQAPTAAPAVTSWLCFRLTSSELALPLVLASPAPAGSS